MTLPERTLPDLLFGLSVLLCSGISVGVRKQREVGQKGEERS